LGQINLKSQYPITQARFQFPAGVAFKYWLYNKVANFKPQITLINNSLKPFDFWNLNNWNLFVIWDLKYFKAHCFITP
jgi:hypothetical protein